MKISSKNRCFTAQKWGRIMGMITTLQYFLLIVVVGTGCTSKKESPDKFETASTQTVVDTKETPDHIKVITAGATPEPPTPSKPGSITHQVAIIGDSITHGGIYPQVFSKALGLLLQNKYPGSVVDGYGIIGQTCSKIEKRFRSDILDHQPAYDTVVIQCGTNDLYNGVGLKRTKKSIRNMVGQAKASDLRPVVVTVGPANGYNKWTPEKEAKRLLLNAWIKKETTAVDVASVLTDSDGVKLKARFYYVDFIHPNDKGLEAMAKIVFEKVF